MSCELVKCMWKERQAYLSLPYTIGTQNKWVATLHWGLFDVLGSNAHLLVCSQQVLCVFNTQKVKK